MCFLTEFTPSYSLTHNGDDAPQNCGSVLAYAENCVVFIATVRQHTAPQLIQYDAVKLHTPGSRVLLEKLTCSLLVKKFPAFFGLKDSLLYAQVPKTCPYPEPHQSNPCPPHLTSWRSILILSSHLHLGLPIGLFPSGFPTKILYAPLPVRAVPLPGIETRFSGRSAHTLVTTLNYPSALPGRKRVWNSSTFAFRLTLSSSMNQVSTVKMRYLDRKKLRWRSPRHERRRWGETHISTDRNPEACQQTLQCKTDTQDIKSYKIRELTLYFRYTAWKYLTSYHHYYIFSVTHNKYRIFR